MESSARAGNDEKKPPPRSKGRALYKIMYAQEGGLLLVFEVPLITVLLAIGFVLILFGGYVPGLIFALVGYVFLGLVARLVGTVGSSQGYVVYLASFVTGPKLTVPVPLADWEIHLPALRRLGVDLSGGGINAALAIASPPEGHEEDPRPEGFAEVVRAIELRLLDESAPLESEHAADPFIRYVSDVAETFGKGPVTLETWRSFLLDRYWGASKACRDRARTHPLSSTWSRIVSGLDEHPGLVYLILGVPPVIVAVVSLIRH